MKYGRYQVVEELGRGSMGVVYKAHDPQIDRLVALKVLRLDRVSTEDYVKRFLKEATAVGRLSHRGIVTVYDVGQDHGTIYIAMELLEGTPLDELRNRKTFSPEEITRLGREVAASLHYAHSKGIVHRDIKPANIICCPDGEIKVTDFGIAHIEDPDGQQMTQAGEILGTPVYMSPEQVMGQTVDGRSDVYSLGVILYELATGSRPFVAKNMGALFKAITGDEVTPPSEVTPQVPVWLSRVIMKAMAREPADRYSSGENLADALVAPVAVEERKKKSGGGRKAVPLVFVSVVLVCAAGFYLFRNNAAFQESFSDMATRTESFVTGLLGKKDEPSPPEEEQVKTAESIAVADGDEIPDKSEHEPLPVELETGIQELVVQETPETEPRGRQVIEPQRDEPPERIVIKPEDTKIMVPDRQAGFPGKDTAARSFEKPPGEEADITGTENREAPPVKIDDHELAESGLDGIFDTPGSLAPAVVPKEETLRKVPEQVESPERVEPDKGVFPSEWKLVEDNTPEKVVIDKVDDKVEVTTPELPKKEEAVSQGVSQEAVREDKVQKVEIITPEKQVVASLPPKKEEGKLALMDITSKPVGASVYVDGKYMGKTPFRKRLSAGPHELRLELQGYGDWEAKLNLAKDMKRTKTIRLSAK